MWMDRVARMMISLDGKLEEENLDDVGLTNDSGSDKSLIGDSD